MNKYIIYGLVDPDTLLVHYVGKTTRGSVRITEHRTKRDSGSKELRAWVAAHPDFVAVILEHVPRPDIVVHDHWCVGVNITALNAAEQWWVQYGRACGWPLLNKTAGGGGIPRPDAASTQARKAWWTPERRATMSAQTRARWVNPDRRISMLEAQNRGKRTPEARARKREVQRTRWTPEAREQAAARAKNQFNNPERRAAASDRTRELWQDPDYRARSIAARKKQAKDPVTQARMSAASRARWADPEWRARRTSSEARAEHAERTRVGIRKRRATRLPG